MFYQEKIGWISRMITKTFKYSRMKYGQDNK